MDPRYEVPEVKGVFGNDHKLGLWQETELAVIKAQVVLGSGTTDAEYEMIDRIWRSTPVDIAWWKARDKEIHHDLNAFIGERVRHLPAELHEHVHKKITSFDTQEAAFAKMLLMCLDMVHAQYEELQTVIIGLARKYRYTLMNARTHGQEAELQTFGARCLTWLRDLKVAYGTLCDAIQNLKYSKISGAIGKWGSIDPELEKTALQILGFEPFYGATQIMPRIIYAPIGEALAGLVLVIDKIANDIRLNARSGRPLMREPFKKKQTGSSAMPHKRNPIRLEQLEGMGRMAKAYAIMIMDNIRTWEERAIEQSCVERVAWPDLFHVSIYSLTALKTVLDDLRVYPDNMLREVYESRGVYASSEAKEFLKERLISLVVGLTYEDAYRIVQLASFNVFEPNTGWRRLRETIPQSHAEAAGLLAEMRFMPQEEVVSIRDFIPEGALWMSDELDVSAEQVDSYNEYLRELFDNQEVVAAWNAIFDPAFLLKNEAKLYKEIIGDD